MLHLGIILLKKSSPALPADTAQPHLALRTAVTQHKNVMFHTSPATWNVRLSVAEGSSRTRPAELVGGLLGGCRSGHNRTQWCTFQLRKCSNTSRVHIPGGWEGRGILCSEKETEATQKLSASVWHEEKKKQSKNKTWKTRWKIHNGIEEGQKWKKNWSKKGNQENGSCRQRELFKNLNYEECCRDRAENKKAMWETSLCSHSSSSTHLSEPEVLSQHLWNPLAQHLLLSPPLRHPVLQTPYTQICHSCIPSFHRWLSEFEHW